MVPVFSSIIIVFVFSGFLPKHRLATHALQIRFLEIARNRLVVIRPRQAVRDLCVFCVSSNSVLDMLMFYNCFMESFCVIADVK